MLGETEARSGVAAGLSHLGVPKGFFFFSSAYDGGVSRGGVLGDPVPGVTRVPVGPCWAMVAQVARGSTTLQPPRTGYRRTLSRVLFWSALAPAPPPASVSLPTQAHAGSSLEGPRITRGGLTHIGHAGCPRGGGRGSQGHGHGTAAGVSPCPLHIPRQKLSALGSRWGPPGGCLAPAPAPWLRRVAGGSLSAWTGRRMNSITGSRFYSTCQGA